LLGQKQPERKFLYREFPSYGGQQSVRVGDWKAIRQNLKPGPAKKAQPDLALQLYNLRTDPSETTDAAKQHPEVVAQLTEILRAQHTASAEFPLPALDRQ